MGLFGRTAVFLGILLSASAFGAACCAGSGPRSFIALQELQKYEFGLSTSFQDAFANFDRDGAILNTTDRQTLTVAVGAGYRIHQDLEAFVIVPTLYQTENYGTQSVSASGLGDVFAGGRVAITRNLFPDEWWPTTVFSFGVKTPTGRTEPLLLGSGIWEPSVGLELRKAFGDFVVNLGGSYTLRTGRNVADTFNGGQLYVEEGDQVELSSSVALTLGQRLSFSLGGSYRWDFDTQVAGVSQTQTAARTLGTFLSSTYFLTRFWSVTGGLEYTPPIQGLGRNQNATRGATVTTNYNFF